MSITAGNWAWGQPVRGTQKLVLLCLADWASGDDCASWHRIGHIADRCSTGKAAVKTALTELEKAGYIAVESRLRENGSQTANCYRLNIKGGSDLIPRPGSEKHPPLSPKVGAIEETSSNEDGKKPVNEVWSTYVEVIKPRHKELDVGSRTTIENALKVRSVAECQRAIVGCAASDWHMGRDSQTAGKSYKRLSNILKGKRGGKTTAEQIDFFIDIADASRAGGAQIDQVRLSRAKQALIQAWTYPNDEFVVQQGEKARAWLTEHGFHIRTVVGRPPRVST